MALIRCPECGRSVSDRAAACPSCGCPISASSNIATSGDGRVPHYDVYLKHPLTLQQEDMLACDMERYGIMTQDMARVLFEEAPGVLRMNATKQEADRLADIARTLSFEVEIVPLPPMTDYEAATVPRCPFCGSFSIQLIRKSGFSAGRAAFGTILAGPLVGAVAGFAGNDKVVRCCVSCKGEW